MIISEKIKELCEKALKAEYPDPLEVSSYGHSISIGIAPWDSFPGFQVWFDKWYYAEYKGHLFENHDSNYAEGTTLTQAISNLNKKLDHYIANKPDKKSDEKDIISLNGKEYRLISK